MIGRSPSDLFSLNPKLVLEQMTGELYARFMHDNAEKHQQWAEKHQAGLTLAHFDIHSIMNWVEYFEPIVPTLVAAISGLMVRRYQEQDDVIIELIFREEWVQEDASGFPLTRLKDYTAQVKVSLMLLVGQRMDMEDYMKRMIQETLIAGLVDAFERYQREGRHPIAPARQPHDPLALGLVTL